MGIYSAILLLIAWILVDRFGLARSSGIYLDQVSRNSQLREFYFPFYNQTLDLIDIVLNDEQRSTAETCSNSLIHLRNGLLDFEEWAVKCMCDSQFSSDGRRIGTDQLIEFSLLWPELHSLRSERKA